MRNSPPPTKLPKHPRWRMSVLTKMSLGVPSKSASETARLTCLQSVILRSLYRWPRSLIENKACVIVRAVLRARSWAETTMALGLIGGDFVSEVGFF